MSGKTLRNLRVQAGLPGHLVSRESALARSRLSDIERGYVEPKPGEIDRIRRAIEALTRARAQVAERAAEVGWPM